MANYSDSTRKEQVLAKLRAHAGEWIDGPELANEQIGGSEGLKRLRELKNEGWLIQMRKKPVQGSDIFQYRIAVQLRVDGSLGYFDPTLHKEEPGFGPSSTGPRRDPAPRPSPAPQGAPSGGFWGSHATDRATNRKSWSEWKPAKKAPGTLECVFWIGKQRVIGAIGQLGPDKWGWGVLVPASKVKYTKERRVAHGHESTREDAREAVEDCITRMRESGEYRP